MHCFRFSVNQKQKKPTYKQLKGAQNNKNIVVQC